MSTKENADVNSDSIAATTREFEFGDQDVVIDPYNSDLNLNIDRDCLLAYPMSQGGFCCMWAGARGTFGVQDGKSVFEVYITDYCECLDLPKDDLEPFLLRVGWSIPESTLQLGEDKLSYAYCSNGKKCTNKTFEDYGETFEKGDSVAAYLDFESNKDALLISFSKNGVDLGVAFVIPKADLTKMEEEKSAKSKEIADKKSDALVFFPHVLSKNVVYEVNFGQRVSFLGDEPFAPIKPDFQLIQKFPIEKRIRGELAPTSKKDCEVILLVGLPCAGKTHWAKELAKKSPEKCYNILGMSSILEKMKMLGCKKRPNVNNCNNTNQATNASNATNVASKVHNEIFDKALKCLHYLIIEASKLNRNIILDQSNIYASVRRRKMELFKGYKRHAVVLIPKSDAHKERLEKCERDELRDFHLSVIYDMKTNFSLPEVGNLFDSVSFAESNQEESKLMVNEYNREGPAQRLQLVESKRVTIQYDQTRTNMLGISSSLSRASSLYGRGGDHQNRFSSSAYPPPPRRPSHPQSRFSRPFAAENVMFQALPNSFLNARPPLLYNNNYPGVLMPIQQTQSPWNPVYIGQQQPYQQASILQQQQLHAYSSFAVMPTPQAIMSQPIWPTNANYLATNGAQLNNTTNSAAASNDWMPAMSTNQFTNTNQFPNS